MLRTNKTGKKFAIARPVKPGASANAPAPTPPSSGAQAPATANGSGEAVASGSSQVVNTEANNAQRDETAFPPTPDATQDRSNDASNHAVPPAQQAAPSSPVQTQTRPPLFFPEPTPPPTQPISPPSEVIHQRTAAPDTSHGPAIGLQAPAHAAAISLAPQMPNPFLHPEPPAPIATSSSYGFAPPASVPHHNAQPSSSRTPAAIQREAVAKQAEKDKRRLSRRKRQGLEGPGRRYRTAGESGEGEVEDDGEGSAPVVEKKKRGRPKNPEGAAKKRKAGKGKGKATDGDDATPGRDQDEEDPEAQVMREEAEGRAGSEQTQSSIAEPLAMALQTAGSDKDDEDEADDTTIRRRGRKRKTVNDDIDLESAVPGQSVGPAIDPSSMTMAEIAAHPGYGRVSARGLELQARRIELAREKREKLLRRKGRAGTEDGSQARESSDDEETNGPETTESAYAQLMKKQLQAEKDARAAAKAKRIHGGHESDPGNNGKDIDPDEEDDDDDINEGDTFRERNAAAQIRIENGNIIIDESSLQIESGQALNDFDMGTMEIVEEHDKDRFINAFSYQRKPRGTRWTREETDLLFEKTREFGTSFDIIMHFFPGKTRKHIINQWNRMCKNQDPRADWAYDVAHRKTIDFSGLEKAANMTFSEQSIDQILEQQEAEMQQEVQALLGLVATEEGGEERQGSPTSSRGGGGNGTDGESSRPMTPAEMARKKAKDKRLAKKAWKEQYLGGEEVVGTIDD